MELQEIRGNRQKRRRRSESNCNDRIVQPKSDSCPFPMEESVPEGLSERVPVELIEQILQKLDVPHVKQTRLVCKAWNREACRVLKGHVIRWIRPEKVPELIRARHESDSLELPTILHEIGLRLNPLKLFTLPGDWQELVKSLFVVTHIDLVIWDCGQLYSDGLNLRRIGLFWNTFSTTLTCLNVLFRNLGHFQDIFSPVCLPNLETFHLSAIPGHSSGGYERTWELHRSILHSVEGMTWKSRKLRTIKVHCWDQCQPNHGVNQRALGRMFNLEQIQNLEIMPQVICFYQLLRQPRHIPRLRSLTLLCDIWCLDRDNPNRELIIGGILRRFSDTLENLKLDKWTGLPMAEWGDNFPKLPVLKVFSCSVQMTLGEAWLTKTPALQELRIAVLSLRGLTSVEGPKTEEVFPSLVKFNLGSVALPTGLWKTNEAMTKFKRTFPNVRRWRITYCCDSLVKFAITDHARHLNFVVEEMECRIDETFPPGMLPGLKRLKLLVPSQFRGNSITLEEKMKELRHHPFLPDLLDLSLDSVKTPEF